MTLVPISILWPDTTDSERAVLEPKKNSATKLLHGIERLDLYVEV